MRELSAKAEGSFFVIWRQAEGKVDPIVGGRDTLPAWRIPLEYPFPQMQYPKKSLFTYSCIVYNADCGFGTGFSIVFL